MSTATHQAHLPDLYQGLWWESYNGADSRVCVGPGTTTSGNTMPLGAVQLLTLGLEDTTEAGVDINLDASICGQELDPPRHLTVFLFELRITTVPPMLASANLTACSIEMEQALTSAAVFLACICRSSLCFIASHLTEWWNPNIVPWF